jgi:hypothetical protein
MKANFYSGLILCVIAVANVLLWIITSVNADTFGQAKTLYLSYFPGLLSNALILTFLNIALCSFSFYLLIRSQPKLGSLHHQLSLILIVLNAMLISWQLFTLM